MQIDSVHQDVRVVFKDGDAVGAKIITIVEACFSTSIGPIGLPWKVVPFPMFKLQTKWIAGALSNRLALPSKEEMTQDPET
ncbi:hypothetical protein AHAS_Ahas19G0301900 [Arachis hypogaea]